MYVYKTTSSFTSAHNFFLHLYFPKDIRLARKGPLTFSHNSESLANLNQ